MKISVLIISVVAFLSITSCSASLRVGGHPHHHFFGHHDNDRVELNDVLPFANGTETASVVAPIVQVH